MYHNIDIVIADDHEIFLDGLAMMLSRQKGFNIVGRAINGQQLLETVTEVKPDVVLTDIKMPVLDGIASTRLMMQVQPFLKVIALSMFNEENLIIEMLEAGAKGYVLKNAHKNEITEAVVSVYENKNYYCAQTTSALAGMIVRSKFKGTATETNIDLSERDKTIIKMICLQNTSQEIADKVYLSRRTIEGYRIKLLEKIKVKNLAGLIVFALKHQLINEDELI
ncbi:response regulator transcription factor [Mucilaginibacter sp. JRF]|uniref:response regulator transcription factor n=1 Tax=Mucilaginibacter sp. JRF TaxID=2780088 RepID=UPI0018812EFE|nr:response regulator transcription factor [Mucilaginibacter sp. JRF]MBE9583369.1 response regulator transcription factor [Mucilaginibacter sp. JRF]